MASGYLLDANSGETYESLAKKRKIIEAMLARGGGSRTPQNIPEGITAVGDAIAGRLQMDKLAASEKKLGAEGDSIFGKGLAAALGGGGEAGPIAGPVAAGPVMADAGAAPAPEFARGSGSGLDVQTGSRLMSDVQRDFSLTPEQAAGVVGNLGHESGGFRTLQEINPTVPGSRGGFGYAQWTGPRRKAFEQFTAEQGLDPKSYEANYGFLKHELQNTPEGAVLPALRAAPDVSSATRVFQDKFLRPGIPGTGSRMNYARQALDLAGAGQLPPPPRSWEIGSPADIPPPNAAEAQGVMPPPVEPPIQMAQSPGTADQMVLPQPDQQVAALAPPMPISPPAGPMQLPPMPEDPSSLGPAQASPSLPQMAALNPVDPLNQGPRAIGPQGFPLPQFAYGGGAPPPPGALPAPAAVQPLPPGREVSAAPVTPIEQVAKALAAQQAPQPQMPMDGRPEGQINVAQALMDAQAREQGAPQGPGMAQASPTVASVAQALGLASSPGGASPQAAMAGPAGQGAAPAQGAQGGNKIVEIVRAMTHPAIKDHQRAALGVLLQDEIGRKNKREEWGRDDRIRVEGRRNVEGDRGITFGREDAKRAEDRQIVVGDRTLTQNREDARRTEDHARADRDRPLDLRTKTATAERAEQELRTGGPLPEARRTWESIKADNDKQEKPTKSFEDWLPEYKRAGAQNINVGGGSDKQIFDAFEKSADDARTAATGLTGLREARAALKAGMITGAGAEARLALQKAAAFFGLADTKAIVNSETFVAAIAPQVASILKATVGNANISNTDREFAEKAGAGKISLDEGSITRLMDIMERASLSRLNLHKNKLDKVYPEKDGKFERERALFGVDLPAEPAAAPAPAPAAPSGAPKAGMVEGGYRFKGGDASDKRNWEKVN